MGGQAPQGIATDTGGSGRSPYHPSEVKAVASSSDGSDTPMAQSVAGWARVLITDLGVKEPVSHWPSQECVWQGHSFF